MTFFGWLRQRHTAPQAQRKPRHVCAMCNATAKAIRHVQAQWVVAGIDRD